MPPRSLTLLPFCNAALASLLYNLTDNSPPKNHLCMYITLEVTDNTCQSDKYEYTKQKPGFDVFHNLTDNSIQEIHLQILLKYGFDQLCNMLYAIKSDKQMNKNYM
ncbi:hypothetical protein C2G38_2044072 [Gigaspora rosea]|uniref:Uncharacterized protein n=1 Tax=Gigaspora rosea TaxID=44941 RepID=A0A397UJR3_9GLOM|nr:hypothetical protein C2G38_2044072 [Gigaspora rosea]